MDHMVSFGDVVAEFVDKHPGWEVSVYGGSNGHVVLTVRGRAGERVSRHAWTKNHRLAKFDLLRMELRRCEAEIEEG